MSALFYSSKGENMTTADQQLTEKYVKVAPAINEHLPGYVDSYFGPDDWMQEARRVGKIPLTPGQIRQWIESESRPSELP
jgi:hypothetical protein